MASVSNPGALVEDGRGGYTQQPPTVIEYPCTKGTFEARSAEESIIQERFVGQGIFVVYLPHDALISNESTITVAGLVCDVLGVFPMKTLQVKRRAVVRARG
jgi:hypothetical protein